MRFDLEIVDEGAVIRVTLSRRNLLALLQKLSMPGSARTLVSRNAYRDGRLVDDLVLVLEAEEDESHYARRGSPPGAMHPLTEQFLARLRARQNGRS